MSPEVQPQILRLTTPNLHPADEDLSAGAPELKNVRGPVPTPATKTCRWGPRGSLLMTDILIEGKGKGKRKSKSKDKGKSNRRSFDSLRSLRMTAFFGGMTVIEALVASLLMNGHVEGCTLPPFRQKQGERTGHGAFWLVLR